MELELKSDFKRNLVSSRKRIVTKDEFVSYPDWYKDAIIYQIHVKAFADSNGDGIGDFRGLTDKLDYLADLGVTALWLLPFYPSPLRDDGYDIADYRDIHPSYGNLRDFQAFMEKAHRLRMHVITELVINHTSDQHEWFQQARRAKKGDPIRDFYVWSDDPEKYKSARIIFKDFEHSNWTWDPVANAYYWHRFYSHQPDLNFENPEVIQAVLSAMDFWMDMGVDGMRLDAVPYLFEKEGTSCENLPETHDVLKILRSHIDKNHSNRMLLAEANQWPEDAVAYFGEGDECHMCFHFPLMPRMYMSLSMEDRFPIIDILNQTPDIPANCQWASFLRNHDELTLEMVTDEERDYMYRMFARDPRARINLGIRRRLAPLLGNNRRQIELMNGLLFSLPGTPIIYYGDEIGMGDNIYLGDRNGVRTPLQWSADRNAGFSRANPQQLYLPVTIDPEYHYESLNVEAQQQNPHSLLWYMKRLIGLQKRYKALSRGTLKFLEPENRKVLAFLRESPETEDERVLVVANLSRHVQCVELDLSEYEGMVPYELFGDTRFPRIGELPYFITLGPHSFYWFSLEKTEEHLTERNWTEENIPAFEIMGDWRKLVGAKLSSLLEQVIPEFVKQVRWFGSKQRQIKSVDVIDRIPLHDASTLSEIVLFRLEYVEGASETYVVPVRAAVGLEAQKILENTPESVLLRFVEQESDQVGILYDGSTDSELLSQILKLMTDKSELEGKKGSLLPSLTREYAAKRTEILKASESPRPLRAEQSNTSVGYGDEFILKLFRKVDEGVNPDLEIGRYLTEKAHFPHTPAVVGSLEYEPKRGQPMTLAITHAYVPNEGDAWHVTLDFLGRYIDHVLTRVSGGHRVPDLPEKSLVEMSRAPFPDEVRELTEPFLSLAYLLGQRTAELHKALSKEDRNPAFIAEDFTPFYQRSLYQSFRNVTDQSLSRLKKALPKYPDHVRQLGDRVLESRASMQEVFQGFLKKTVSTVRTRTHGDFHLGQVLFIGNDFVIIDFEGEPARSLTERKIKRCPLRDVAGMLRSFHYATHVALSNEGIRKEDLPKLEPWLRYWRRWISAAYLKGYLTHAEGSRFLPKNSEDLRMLLNAFAMEKALYEVSYELGSRPEWLHVPLQGILQLLEEPL